MLGYIKLEASELASVSANHMTRNRYSVSSPKILIGASLVVSIIDKYLTLGKAKYINVWHTFNSKVFMQGQ